MENRSRVLVRPPLSLLGTRADTHPNTGASVSMMGNRNIDMTTSSNDNVSTNTIEI